MLLWVVSWEGKKAERGGGLGSVVSKVEGIPRLEEGFPRGEEGFPRYDLTEREMCDFHNGLSTLGTGYFSTFSVATKANWGSAGRWGAHLSRCRSCLLSTIRRLRDDLLAGKIFDGMIRRGGNELSKRSVGMSLENCGNSVAQAKREQSDKFSGEAGVDRIGTKAKNENF